MKSMRAIQFRHLPEMAEIMIGPLVEHLCKRDTAKLRMYTGASTRGTRQTCQERKRRAPFEPDASKSGPPQKSVSALKRCWRRPDGNSKRTNSRMLTGAYWNVFNTLPTVRKPRRSWKGSAGQSRFESVSAV